MQGAGKRIGRNHSEKSEADGLNGIVGREVVFATERADLLQYLGASADLGHLIGRPPAFQEQASYRWRQLVRKTKGLFES